MFYEKIIITLFTFHTSYASFSPDATRAEGFIYI